MPIKPWEGLGIHYEKDYHLFKVKIEQRKHPISNQIGNFVLLDSADWVNIIPITSKNELVVIRQFRHGTSTITTEIPGGLVEAGEDVRIAAKRECIEETGYSSQSEAKYLGFVYPNPAFLTNKCHTFLWENCELTQSQKLDEFEDIEVVTIPIETMLEQIVNSEINHSVIMSALMLYYAQTMKSKWEK